MTLHFQMRREDALAFARAYNEGSPTFRRARNRARIGLPLIMLAFWLYTTYRSGFSSTATLIYLGIGLLWLVIGPGQFNRNVAKYNEKTVDEETYRKTLGPCELTLSETGLHSISPIGESQFSWSTVDRIGLTDSYLFIFLIGPIGYAIPINDIGQESAIQAYEYVNRHLPAPEQRAKK